MRKISRWILSLMLISMPLSAGTDHYYHIINETDFFLNVIADQKHYLHIPPGGEVEVEGDSEIEITVYYSPGQEVTGRGERTLTSDQECCGTDCDCDDDDDSVYIANNRWTVNEHDLN